MTIVCLGIIVITIPRINKKVPGGRSFRSAEEETSIVSAILQLGIKLFLAWRMKRGQRMLLTISFIGDIDHSDTHDEHHVCATQTESIGFHDKREVVRAVIRGKCGERTRSDLPELPHLNLGLRASAFLNRFRLL